MGLTMDLGGGSPRPWRWIAYLDPALGVHVEVGSLCQRDDNLVRIRHPKHAGHWCPQYLGRGRLEYAGCRADCRPDRRLVADRSGLGRRVLVPAGCGATVHRGVGDGGPSVPRPARRIQKLRSGAGGRPLDHVRHPRVVSQTGTSSTVAGTTISVEDTGTHHCTGGVDLVSGATG